jgi:hypothetical protein
MWHPESGLVVLDPKGGTTLWLRNRGRFKGSRRPVPRQLTTAVIAPPFE